MRIFVGGSVGHGIGIKNHQVGKGPFADSASVLQPVGIGRFGGQFGDGFFEREQFAISDTRSKDPRRRAIDSGVNDPSVVIDAIGSDHAQVVLQQRFDLLVIAFVEDDQRSQSFFDQQAVQSFLDRQPDFLDKFFECSALERGVILARHPGQGHLIEVQRIGFQCLSEVASHGGIFEFRHGSQRPVVPRVVGHQVVEHCRPGLIRVALVGKLDLVSHLVKQCQQRIDRLFVSALDVRDVDATSGPFADLDGFADPVEDSFFVANVRGVDSVVFGDHLAGFDQFVGRGVALHDVIESG